MDFLYNQRLFFLLKNCIVFSVIKMHVNHTLKPIYDKNSKVLILGSIPSVKSREIGFYYSHPKNRFWVTLERVYNEKIGNTIQEKIMFLKEHYIALFDVLKSCDISSSSDSSIKQPVFNDLIPIIKGSNIKVIFTTGRKAYQLYQKYCYPKTKIEAIYLPSTSPANCPNGIDKKLENAYIKVKNFTDD